MRPDGRRFLRPPARPTSAGHDLYVAVDEADAGARRLYERHGFVVNRLESVYSVPTDPAVTGLRAASPPEGFVLVSADTVDLDCLRKLDDALRQDVPGTEGWRWDAAGFREETLCAEFDPATYLVAVEQEGGAFAGLVRVWINRSGPRLGLIGVLTPYRRRGLARALLARAFRALHERGARDVTTEVDAENVAATALIRQLGARRSGGSIEYVRRA